MLPLDPGGDGWRIVAQSRRRGECHELALVLDALSIPHLIADGPHHSALLLVPVEEAARAERELKLYRAENRPRPPRPTLELPGLGLAGALVYALVLIAVFYLDGRSVGGFDWRAAGALDGEAFRAGEWWRAVTALTLHADGAHLIANLVFGAFFGAVVAQYLGSGIAWTVILLTAGAGNALDLALLPAEHRAIGASTAVFAALGLVGALMWRGADDRHATWARRFAPLIGAVVLLAYLGTGDAETDAVAHLTGFAAGLGAGMLSGLGSAMLPEKSAWQAVAGGGALLLLATCWWLALQVAAAGLA